MDTIILNKLQEIKSNIPLGQQVKLIGEPSTGDFKPVGTTLIRSEYPQLSAMYPSSGYYYYSYSNMEPTADIVAVDGATDESYNYVGIGGSTVHMSTGATGFLWTKYDYGEALHGIAYKAGAWYTATDTLLLKSTDVGATWSSTGLQAIAGIKEIKVINNNLYVMTQTSIYKSTDDGVSFTEYYCGGTSICDFAVLNNGTMIAVMGVVRGASDSIIYSTNGTDWYSHSFLHNDDLCRICSSGTIAVITTLTSQYIYSSTDGINWQESFNPAFSQMQAMTFSGSRFLGHVNGIYPNWIIQSTNGVDWTINDSSSGLNVLASSIFYAGGNMYLVCGTGTYPVVRMFLTNNFIIELTGDVGEFVRVK